MRSLAVMLLLFSSGDALQCYSGGCMAPQAPCSEEMSLGPNLQKTTCSQGEMCFKQTALLNSQEKVMFGCVPAAKAGCKDLKVMPEGHQTPSDSEMCLCDTDLCNTYTTTTTSVAGPESKQTNSNMTTTTTNTTTNTASKKAFIGFLFFFLLNIVI